MNKKMFGIFVLLGLLLANTAFAQTPSVVLKRMNPGIAKVKSAEIIFSVANINTEHKIQGLMLCRTPDDAYVTSAWGTGVGDAAQYIGPVNTILEAGLGTISLTLDADTPGDKHADCTFKYIPYKETITESKTAEQDVKYEGTIGTTAKSVEGFLIKLISFTEAVEATNETEAVSAKANIDVDGTTKEISMGATEVIGSLSITVNSATAEGADVSITGTKTVTIPGVSTKEYLLMTGEYVTEMKDQYYRTIRLDKTVPFVVDMSNPQCAEGKTECKSAEVIEAAEVGGKGLAKWLQNYPIWIVIGLLVLGVVYILGRR